MTTGHLDFILLIPCYNNRNGLITSLESIQYAKDKCEVLIVDDGSTEPLSIIDLQSQVQNLIIKIIRHQNNQGIVNALNTGLREINNRNDVKYIARLDAGDTCHSERFYKQVDFLNTHPECALLGSWATFLSSTGNNSYSYITQTSHDAILKEMHYKCSFIHPAVIFRKDVLDKVGLYPTEYSHAEDYAFFWKILLSYKGAIIPEKLVSISFSVDNVSSKNYKTQLNSRRKIVKQYGDQFIPKMIGIVMLGIKQFFPKAIIKKLKYLKK
jgi:glycosyltransferase involved in cell wall biosynthesis